MSDGTWRITYEGDAATVAPLVDMLEREGLRVAPPGESRDLVGMGEGVVVTLVAEGLIAGARLAVARYKERFPRPRVEIDDAPSSRRPAGSSWPRRY